MRADTPWASVTGRPVPGAVVVDALTGASAVADAAGRFEVVLAGVHLGTYGAAHGETLLGLVRRVLAIEGLGRLRLSAIERTARKKSARR